MFILVKNAPDASWQKKVVKTAEKFIKAKGINHQASLNVFFVSKRKIRALNRKYRKLDSSTDVLSFPVWHSLKEIPKEGEVSLGDIFICPEETDLDNLTFLIEHSLDHLIGKHH